MNLEMLMKVAHAQGTATLTASGCRFPVKITEIDHSSEAYGRDITELKCLVLGDHDAVGYGGYVFKNDKEFVNGVYGKRSGRYPWGTVINFAIEKVIFNNPATIVFWKDGTKTVVKANNEDYDPEKGLAMAIAKKALGNKGNYFNEVKKWVDKCDYDPNALRCSFGDWLKLENAYVTLTEVMKNKKATKSDMVNAMEEAIGYLGEVLR